MSAGSFVASKYEADSGSIHFIQVQPETLAATFDSQANDAPSEGIDSPFAAEVSRGARSYGLRPRYVRVAFEDSPPTGYRPYTTITIPVLDETIFGTIAAGDAVEYNGGTGKVTRKVGESLIPGSSVIEEEAAEPAV